MRSAAKRPPGLQGQTEINCIRHQAIVLFFFSPLKAVSKGVARNKKFPAALVEYLLGSLLMAHACACDASAIRSMNSLLGVATCSHPARSTWNSSISGESFSLIKSSIS
jgi:hypothetical protein